MVHERSLQDGGPGLFHAQVDTCIREIRQRNFEELFRNKRLRESDQDRRVLSSERKDRDARTILHSNSATLAVTSGNVCRSFHGRKYTGTKSESTDRRSPYRADMIRPNLRSVF
jgi:hypothetical protein